MGIRYYKYLPSRAASTAIAAVFMLTALTIPAESASVVSIQQKETGWNLLLNGKPYFVKGAGGSQHLDQIILSGGNSVRTWGVDQTILDQAAKLGLTVTMGIWDPATEAESSVKKYKDSDALLIWALGNEMETRASDQVTLWKQLNTIAQKVKSIDPNHPVMTVVAEIGDDKVKQIISNFPALDILGINSYGGATSLGDRLAKAGWVKPYMVTEFGPLGHWEVATNEWGVPIEQSSTSKANTCLTGYTNSIANRNNCLGSYVFLWGDKQEKTHTWYGMFLPDNLGGNRLAQVDAISYAWTGSWPVNRCPVIGSHEISIDPSVNPGDGHNRFSPGSKISCIVDASDPENADLTVKWDLRKDATLNPQSGGAQEPENPPISGAVESSSGLKATIALPVTAGLYRVHVYVYDPRGNAATVNLPINVDKSVSYSVVNNQSNKNLISSKATGDRYNLLGRCFESSGIKTEASGRGATGLLIDNDKKEILIDGFK